MNLDTVTRHLSPKQVRSIAGATARLNIWQGSVRSGKTIASLIAWLGYVADAPAGGELVVIGRTREAIGRNVFGPLQDAAIVGPLARTIHYTTGAPTATILGRKVHVIGASDVKAEAVLRGMTCAGAYVDEATVIPEVVFKQLLARLSVAGARLFTTTNPDNPTHWFRQDYLLRSAQLDMASWHFVLDDNPALDPAYVASLKQEYTGLWYRRFILGEWVLAEGAVYDMWDEDRHIVDDLPVMARWLALGVDYGTINPFSGLILAAGEDGCLYLTREWRWDSRLRRRQLTDGEYSERLRQWLTTVPRPGERGRVAGVAPEWWVIDPSAASFKTQLWRDGVSVVQDADNSVVDGIRLVSTLLGAGKLRVHRSCQGWLDEVTGYSWDDDKAEKGEDVPIKVADHSLDAGRYAIATTEWAWRPLIGLEAA